MDNPIDPSALWQPFREDTSEVRDCLGFHKDYGQLLESTELLAYLIRSYTVYQMTCASLGHPGGSFSEAETLAVLFNYAMRFNASEPEWPMRDVFYLSKCHACPALYVVLGLFDYFPLAKIRDYGAWGSGLESHPDRLVTPGIEVSGGSLGQIPGIAVGRALGIRRNGPDHNDRRVFVLIGDGECNEGSVWEAFMAAGHYGLDNLVFLIDYNKVQAKGPVSQDMTIEPLADKLAAFNLDVYETDNGHDVSELVDLFTGLRMQRRGRPVAVVINTVKGHKVRQCELNPNWHTSAPRSAEQATDWLVQLWRQDGRRLGVDERFPTDLGQAIEKVGPVHDNPDQMSDRQA